MLLDGAIRSAEQARQGVIENNYEQSYLGSKQCRAILTELISSVSPEVDPVLCERISSLYTFFYNELVSAMSERDAEKIGKLIPLLEYERETWELAIARIAEGQDVPARASDGAIDGPEGLPRGHFNGSLNLSG